MALRRQPLAVIQDENAEIKRGKPNVGKNGGLKAQQPDLSDRKTLSNITNKLKPLQNAGTATPLGLRKEGLRAGAENNNHAKGGFTVMEDPEILGKSGVKGRGGNVQRTPLTNIANVESLQNSFKAPDAMAGKMKKAQAENMMGPSPMYEVTEEMKRRAEVWAREGIEKVHFSGKDMDALREKMAKEEMNRMVEQALSCRTEIPCWLPRALVKDPPEIKDHLELRPVEDLCTKINDSYHGMEEQLTDVDYDEYYLECLEILQNASKDWPAVVEQCVS